MAVGWRPTTLWVRRGWASNFKVKTYGLKKETFLLYNVINAKEASYETRAIKAPQSEPRTRKNKKQEEEVRQAKDFKQAKQLKHLKQGRDKVSRIHRMSPYIKYPATKDLHFSTTRRLNSPTFPFSSISTLRYLHIPTFGRQVIAGQHFHSSAVIKANRVARLISATRHLNSSTFRSAGTSRELDDLYVRLP